MKSDFITVIGLGLFILASIFVIGALANQSIKSQNIICQEGC